MATHALAFDRASSNRAVAGLRRSLNTLRGSVRLIGLLVTLWLSSFRAGGVSAVAKAVVWTLIWPFWLVYLIAFVGIRF